MNATAEHSENRFRGLAARVRPLLGAVTLLAAALVVDDRLLSASWRQILAAIELVPTSAVLLAAVATLAGLAAASAYDALTPWGLGRPLRWRNSAPTSVLAFALSHGGALGAVAVLALRRKAYAERLEEPRDMERLMRWSPVVGALGGAALLILGLPAVAIVRNGLHLPFAGYLALGAAGAGLVGAYLFAPRAGLAVNLAPPRQGAWRQVAVSTVEWTFAALALYAVLPPESRGPVLSFMPVYGMARLLGAASGLPAGVGVFEAVVLAALSVRIPTHQLAAGLVLYRLVYSVAPLVLAACRVALASAAAPRKGESASVKAGREAVNAALPGVLGLLVFVSGGVMLLSAATPGSPERLRLSAAFTPVVVLETSHFLDSLIGALLLFLAFGMNNRLRKAWQAAIVLMIIGAFSTLVRGLNYEEAGFLTLVTLLLVAGRSAFYRTAPLSAAPLTPGMALSILAAVASILWLGFFAFRNVAYRDELWWTFVADEEAPRLLRASVGVATLVLALFAWRLIRPRARIRVRHDPAVLARVETIMAQAEDPAPDSHLAYLGDKQFLFSETGESFIQYAARNRNWVALGEPVGPVAERRDMIWAFREQCDRHGAIPVFYAIRRDSLADFIDCGFVAAKIGENAVVDLQGFTLVGRARQDLRTARSRAGREGLTFAVISAEEVRARMRELEAISDAWLERHQGEEKGFSLGRFDAAYVGRFDAAVLRRGDEIIAFTNLWRTADGRRIAVDLMRYAPDAPPGAMEALLVELLLWAQAQGCLSCDLGRTPLAGLEAHRLANFMTLVGSLIYTHAGRLYGFDGLRRFKAKFFPRWESIYIAAPTGWRLPTALGDAALLSSGGVRGLLREPPRAQKKGRAPKGAASS